jgi:hypothetical protein
MDMIYRADPVAAVRGQHFIKTLHGFIAEDLESRLSTKARNRGVTVKQEAKVYGSHKPKDVDVAVLDPGNGPLMLIGVRSQMSSVAKNVLTYYQDIVGECISLQDRFPLAVYGYAYLHPLQVAEQAAIDHARYARMYESISGRDGRNFREIKGVYDQFAYMVVDFDSSPVELRDDVIATALKELDLSITTFVDRLVETFKDRNLWIDVFV